jgi:hypothetical protein
MPSSNSRTPFLSVTMKDCDLQTFRSGGPGGQHQNKSETGVRIVHRASGAVGESREHRSQLQNKHAAWRRMAEHPKFKVWLNRQLWYGGALPEQRAKQDMNLSNLKIEGKKNGKWVPIDESQ